MAELQESEHFFVNSSTSSIPDFDVKVYGREERTLREAADGAAVLVLDQTALPRRVEHVRLETLEDAARAIGDMLVRGAPLVGVTAAYGLALGLRADPTDAGLDAAMARLLATRPTAVNLRWALAEVREAVEALPADARAAEAWRVAGRMAEADVEACEAIGRHGAALLQKHADGTGPLDVLTHCNAGWLATIDWGTALAPVYRLHDAGVPVHVWVSETRPRNQGLLTAWELSAHGIPCTLLVDNAAGLLMQRGRVDVCIVGTDRVTRTGDVCNKIGTLLKALAAREYGIPFYVAAPSSSIDFTLTDPIAIPIEERSCREVVEDESTPAVNPGFDVTPGRYVTALITERGSCPATEAGLASLFPERANALAAGIRP